MIPCKAYMWPAVMLQPFAWESPAAPNMAPTCNRKVGSSPAAGSKATHRAAESWRGLQLANRLSAARYDWLNRIVAVGDGHRLPHESF
jgi:hypothetical protein